MIKLLAIVGPTSSGKSELAVKLARHFHGEIISADSRQVYKGMDIGTGKVEGHWTPLHKTMGSKMSGRSKTSDKVFVYKGVPHHLIDFQNPKRQLSAAQFQLLATQAIQNIAARGNLPILCGGTGHWIDAAVFNQHFPEVPPNIKLRSSLEKKSADNLYEQLQKLDPTRAQNIDRFNKRRLIRALEIVITTGRPVPPASYKLQATNYHPFWIGINFSQDELYAKIKKRLNQRLKQGMLKEVARLHKQGLSYKRLESFGLEYKFCSLYLRKKMSSDEMFSQLLLAIQHYAKRQMTWWKRNKDIHWIHSPDQAAELVEKFLK